MNDSFKIEGLTEFQNKLVNTLMNKQKKYDQLRLKVGKRILENAAKQVKSDGLVETERLLNSFEEKPYVDKKGVHTEWVNKLIGKDVVKAGSEVWYSGLVEEGHIISKKKSKNRKKGQSFTTNPQDILGFVPGKHYFRKAMEKTYSELPELINEFLIDLGKGAGFDVKS